MSVLTNQIKPWAAKELRYWEQAALEKVASRGVLQNEDFQELLQYFIEDAGLAPIPANRPRLSFAGNNITEAEPEPCRLERIFNLKNVNALPDGQEIRLVL